MLYVYSLDNILSTSGIKKVLIRLCGCTGWSAPLLLACNIIRFSHVEAHLLMSHFIQKLLYMDCLTDVPSILSYIFLLTEIENYIESVSEYRNVLGYCPASQE